MICLKSLWMFAFFKSCAYNGYNGLWDLNFKEHMPADLNKSRLHFALPIVFEEIE